MSKSTELFTEHLPLKAEVAALKAEIESLFQRHGEIRPSELAKLSRRCFSLSLDANVLKGLIAYIKHQLIAQNNESKQLIHWVNNLYLAFEENANYGSNKSAQWQLLQAAELTTGKSITDLTEIFSSVKNQQTQQTRQSAAADKNAKAQQTKNSEHSHHNAVNSSANVSAFRRFFLVIALLTVIIIGIFLTGQSKLFDNNLFKFNRSDGHSDITADNKLNKKVSDSAATSDNTKGSDIRPDKNEIAPLPLTRLNIIVKPAAAKIQLTKLKINSPKLAITSNNSSGQTPLITYQPGMLLPYGEYQLQLVASGYESLTTRLVLNQAQQQVSAELRKNLPKAIQALEQSLIVIPEGLFVFPLQKDNKTKQQHYLDTFKLMNSEVTFAMWDTCYQHQACRYAPNDYGWGREQRPVIDVSQQEINQQFIPWLNNLTGHIFALPTETQWEYAANLPNGREYSWGDVIGNNNSNCANCGSPWDNQQTAPVKSFTSNTQGLYDLNGNVWELTQDCWSPHLTKPQTNGAPWLSEGCNSAVIKGGSYMAKAKDITLSTRNWVSIDTRSKAIGFRLIKVLAVE